MAAQPASSLSPDSGFGGAGAYVLDQFREFYDEVQVLRDFALKSGRAGDHGVPEFMDDGGAGFPGQEYDDDDGGAVRPPPLPGFAKPGAEPPLPTAEDAEDEEDLSDRGPSFGLTAEEAVRRLQTLLEMQALEAGRRGGEYGVLYYQEAQYVMAALADEIFLNLDWSGRDHWRNDLLETRLFDSYNAGDQVFKRLERLLQTGDRVQAEIAVVYLMALTLGFRGRYAGGRSEARIAEYRKQLYYYIFQRRPDLADPSHRLVNEPYQHTQGNVNARLLPSPARWLWLLGFVCVAYLVASHFVFHDALQPLIDALEAAGA